MRKPLYLSQKQMPAGEHKIFIHKHLAKRIGPEQQPARQLESYKKTCSIRLKSRDGQQIK
jgi:hypothetical protein